jgi:hypothetical protein
MIKIFNNKRNLVALLLIALTCFFTSGFSRVLAQANCIKCDDTPEAPCPPIDSAFQNNCPHISKFLGINSYSCPLGYGLDAATAPLSVAWCTKSAAKYQACIHDSNYPPAGCTPNTSGDKACGSTKLQYACIAVLTGGAAQCTTTIVNDGKCDTDDCVTPGS